MSRAAIYARYSSHAQNDESIEQQVGECQSYAAAHGLTVVATFADRAISGRSDRRPEFQRMIKAAEAGDFETVIAYKSNRIARNMLQALQYEARLDRCGVRVVYAREEFGDTATGRFMLRSMMNLNQFYSENMAEDIVRGMNENARQARANGKPPLGYRIGADGHYEIDPRTAPIVREIFDRLAAGESYAAIADDLNRRHIPTASGGTWNKGSFHRMCTNERYTGVYLYGDVRVEGGMPAIVPRELFERVRDLTHHRAAANMARRRTPGVVYALTGKLFCGECRARMCGVSGKGKSGAKYSYYKCTGCGRLRARKDEVEALVVQTLRDAIMNDETIDRLVEMVMAYRDELRDKSEADAIAARLLETRASKANIVKAIESGIVSQTLADRLNDLERAEADLTGQLAAAKMKIPDVTEDAVRFYFKQFRAGDVRDPAYQRLLIDTFLRAAWLYPDRLTVGFSFDDRAVEVDAGRVLDDDGVSFGATWGHQKPLKLTLRMVGCLFVLTVPRTAKE